MKLDDSDNTSEQAKSPSTPTSTDTKIEETKKPTSKDELNVLATDSDDIITKILFELKYGKNFSGTANLKKINEATTALKTLLTSEKNKARIDELKQLEPPEQYEEYAKLMGSEACRICGFNAITFRAYIADRLAQLNSLQGE